MTTYYKIVKGLGKDDIGIAGFACIGCKKVGITLYGVIGSSKAKSIPEYGRVKLEDLKEPLPKKAYACGECKDIYERR